MWASVPYACLARTGGAYCLLEVSLAPGMAVPRHTHTREDEVYFVLAGELEATVGEETFVLQPGETLLAPRDIPHELRNSGDATNHFLLVFHLPGSRNSSWPRPFPRLKMRLLQRSPRQLPLRMFINLPPALGSFRLSYAKAGPSRRLLASWCHRDNRFCDPVEDVIASTTRSVETLLLVTFAITLVQKATARENHQQPIQKQILLMASSSWDGGPYKCYPPGQPELSVPENHSRITLNWNGIVIRCQALPALSLEN